MYLEINDKLNVNTFKKNELRYEYKSQSNISISS